MLQNHTWELVDLSPGSKPLGYEWIFKKKMKADGSIDKYIKPDWLSKVTRKKKAWTELIPIHQ